MVPDYLLVEDFDFLTFLDQLLLSLLLFEVLFTLEFFKRSLLVPNLEQNLFKLGSLRGDFRVQFVHFVLELAGSFIRQIDRPQYISRLQT